MIKKIIATSLIVISSTSFATESTENVYLRGDIGVFKQSKKFKNSGVFEEGERFKTAPVYGVGVGYKFDENYRTDLNLQYRNLHYKYSKHSTHSNQKTQSYSLLLNGYYDFKNESIFTPYITAGIGVSRNKPGVSNLWSLVGMSTFLVRQKRP